MAEEIPNAMRRVITAPPVHRRGNVAFKFGNNCRSRNMIHQFKVQVIHTDLYEL